MTKTYPNPVKFNCVKEDELLSFIENRAGKEIYRPRLDLVKECYQEIAGDTKFNTLTIGGTNGKGSTSLNVSKLLHQNNISHGLLLSPHVLSITERMSFNGENISYDHLMSAVSLIFERFEDKGPSFYEALFLSFIKIAKDLKIKNFVLEVGLGGKYDAVNSIDADFTSIVSISKDHQEILGNSLKEILGEKLGITRPGSPLLTSFESEFLVNQAKDHCESQGIPYKNLKPELGFTQSNKILGERVVKEWLGIEDKVEEFNSIGRGHELSVGESTYQFYGSHNPDGISKLFKGLYNSNVKFDSIFFSLSERSLDDLNLIKKVIETYPCVSGEKYISTDDHFKKSTQLQNIFKDYKFLDTDSFLKRESKSRILVFGSYYFLGEFYRRLQ